MTAELVVLFAHWCPKCNMMMPIIEEIEEQYQGRLIVKRIDIEKESEIARDYSIQIIPTFVIIKKGQEIARMAGIIEEQLFQERIDAILEQE